MASSPTPPLTLDLTWQGGMRFAGSVWLSLRQDIELIASFDIVSG